MVYTIDELFSRKITQQNLFLDRIKSWRLLAEENS